MYGCTLLHIYFIFFTWWHISVFRSSEHRIRWVWQDNSPNAGKTPANSSWWSTFSLWGWEEMISWPLWTKQVWNTMLHEDTFTLASQSSYAQVIQTFWGILKTALDATPETPISSPLLCRGFVQIKKRHVGGFCYAVLIIRKNFHSLVEKALL